LGAVGIGHVQERFGICRSVSYAIVARLVEAGLIERIATLPGDPTLLCATRQGIAYAGLGLPPARVTPGAVDHRLACADVALWAERRWGPESLQSERELRFAEQFERRPIASAVVGERPGGRARLHQPDLVITNGEPDRDRGRADAEGAPAASGDRSRLATGSACGSDPLPVSTRPHPAGRGAGY